MKRGTSITLAICTALSVSALSVAQEVAPPPANPAPTTGAPAPVNVAPGVSVPAATPPAPPPPQAVPKATGEVAQFLDRVFAHLPAGVPTSYEFESWEQAGKPTDEGVGLMPAAGTNIEAMVKRIMDVDHYKGNIDAVLESRTLKDTRFSPPKSVRFYQRINLSAIGEMQMDLVLVDEGVRKGYRTVFWYLNKPETKALDRSQGMRSDYNVGAWLISDKAVGYALSSAPLKDDCNFLQWQSLTTGADLAAKPVVETNIKGMIKWSKR